MKRKSKSPQTYENRSLSEIKASEYLLSYKRLQRVTGQFAFAVLFFILMIFYSLIMVRYLHNIYIESAVALIDLVIVGILFRKLRVERKFFEVDCVQLDEKASALLQLEFERFYLHLHSIIYFLIPTIAIELFLVYSFFAQNGIQSGGDLSFHVAIFHAALLFLLSYLLLDRGLMIYSGRPCLEEERRQEMRKHLNQTSFFCIAFWIAVILFMVFQFSHGNRGRIPFFLLLELYLLIGLAANIRKRQQMFHFVSKASITACVVSLALCFVVSVMHIEHDYLSGYVEQYQGIPYDADEIAYNEQTGEFTITTDKEEFKILQLSDIHLGGSRLSVEKDRKALEACYQIIKEAEPDLVMVTGDLVFAVGVGSYSFNNLTQVHTFAQFMEKVGIPWAFTYGNHDTEFLSSASPTEIEQAYLEHSYGNEGILLYPETKPDIYGRCNQLITIRNSDDSLREALFLIDSNACAGLRANYYDGIHEDQIDWYVSELERLSEEEGELPASLIYMHIPPKEMKEANALYEEGSSDVIHRYGILPEDLESSPISSANRENSLFREMKRLGSTKDIFFGHDHFTTLSYEYEGIGMNYGLSIDYITMSYMTWHTYQRGGTLLSISRDGAYDIDRCLLAEITGEEVK